MPIIDGYLLPEDCYFTSDHAWLRLESSRVLVGLDDFAQKLAGTISFIKLPRVGKNFAVGQSMISLQSGKWTGRIMAPVSGTVVAVNQQLAMEPSLVNQDPYGEGWICVMEPTDLAREQASLLSGAAAAHWLREEVHRHASS